jgi:predicted dehydrogenase
MSGRDAGAVAAAARAYGVPETVTDWRELISRDDVDVVDICTPPGTHAQIATEAAAAGKAVLCEKPLSVGSAQTKDVLDAAAAAAAPLWEAFVFPFQAQHQRLVQLLADGAVGEPAELYSAFHFLLSNRANIRMDAALGGGALADVGCYPIRLALELFGTGAGAGAGTEPQVEACSALTEGEVETDAAGIVAFGARRLLLTCGFNRSYDTFSTVLGRAGQIQLTNPFHPGPADTLTVLRPGAAPLTEHPTTDQRSFTAAIRHIHAVLRGESAPRHTAAEYALPAARVLEQLQRLARPAGEGR